MRRRNLPTRDPGRRPPPRDPMPRGLPSQVLLILSGVGLYFGILWLGIEVIGDTATRSAVMAALIVVIAGVGYAFTRHPTKPGDR